MHTVELLELATHAAEQAGYRIRRDWLAGQGGGACEIRSHKWLLIDLSVDHGDQLDEVVAVLRSEPAEVQNDLPEELKALIHPRLRRVA